MSLPTAPRVLAILAGFNPSGIIGVLKPLMALDRQGAIRFRLAVEAYLDVASLRQADLVVFCRNLEPRYRHVLDAVQALGLPYIYDLDDNLFDVPAGTQDGQYYRDPERQALLARYVRGADVVRVYAPLLHQRLQPLNPGVELLTPPLDWDHMQPPPLEGRSGPVKLVYATSRKVDHLFPIFEPALLEALRRYPERLAIYFWGFRPPAFAGLPNVHYRKFMANYDHYLRAFSGLGFDIGLAPLLDDEFHSAKTNLKFREYGACGIAGIYSNVPVYAGSVEDGRTGLLVENTTRDWLEALVRLVEDDALRLSIGRAARQVVQERFSPAAFNAEWRRQIESVLQRHDAAHQGRAGSQAAASPAGTVPGTPGGPFPELERAPMSGLARPYPVGTAPTRFIIWRDKLRRALQLVRAGDRAHYVEYSRAHLNNLWWLFKINRLKRL